MKEFEDLVITAYVILIGVIATTTLVRFLMFAKTRNTRVRLSQERMPFRLIRSLTLVAIPFFLWGLINYLFIFQKGNLFAPYWAKLTLVLVLVLFLINEYRFNLSPRARTLNRIFNIVFLVMMLFLGFIFNRAWLRAFQHPDEENSVVIDLPFHGTWIASGAGGTALTNHHDRIKSQKYAIDIVRFGDNGRLFEGEGIANTESYTFGATVIAPVDGTVVHLVDSLPDVKITERDKLAGNHVIIRFQDSLYVALAHLRQGSIRVNTGDIVTTGDILAEVGNSGNTDFPHLHIHIQNTPVYDIDESRSYPVRFRNFKRMRYLFWTTETDEFLLSNDIVKKAD